MKHLRVVAVLAAGLLAYFGWSALHPQNAAASSDPSGTFVITINDATTGEFVSHTVIALHADHTAAAVDSGQEGQFPVPFSSQLGAWALSPGGVINVRTVDWSFPFATQGSARVDYKFNAGVPGNQVAGSIVLTIFPPNGDPLDGGGTPGGTFNFTGNRVTAP
jgi:hypothetical protein